MSAEYFLARLDQFRRMLRGTGRSRLTSILPLLLIAFATAASEAHAQRSVSIGIMGGATLPLGDLDDNGVETGFNIAGIAEIGAPLVPLSFRIDAMWSQLDYEFDGGIIPPGFLGDPDDGLRLVSVTGNFKYAMSGIGLRPYLMGGGGYYNVRAAGAETQHEVGINAGAGLELLLTGLTTFAEVRFHHIFTEGESMQILPISVGIRF